MIRPEFSGQHIVNTRDVDDILWQQGRRDQRLDQRHFEFDHYHDKQPNKLLERYVGDRNWRRVKEARSPRPKRRIDEEDVVSLSMCPKMGSQRHDLSEELYIIGRQLELFHKELTGKHMKSVIREIDIHKSSNPDQIYALKELFERLNTEMVYLKTVLSQHGETNYMSTHQDMKTITANAETTTSTPYRILSSHGTGADDLVHMKGPLTENTVITVLQERFMTHYYHTRIGPVLVAVNSFGCCESDEEILQKANSSPFLKTLVRKSIQQLFESNTSQMLILSGECGSGKTFTAQMLIQHLLQLTCGGIQTDLAKQLIASITVLRSLGKAKTDINAESSRMAMLYEFYFSNRITSKVKLRCYPLDMTRITHPKDRERNFHIFYQLFAGLNPKDRAKLQLQTHNAQELRYLYYYPLDDQAEINSLRKQFHSWKTALSVLGIPFGDVTRVLAAILLLGNVLFTEKSTRVLEVHGGDFELKAVAVLLGVAYTSLFRGLTKRSKLIHGEITVQPCSAAQANFNRDALSKALYSRMLFAIVRRCNSSRKCPSSVESSPNSSSESLSRNDHVLSEKMSEKTSQVHVKTSDVTSLPTSPKQNHNDVGIIGIADLFGFENSECNGMEQLCTNLCAETIQHFYTTHIFKSTEGYCREEGLQNEVDVDYADNSSCIELLTSQGTGILTYLDHETLDVGNGSVEKFLEKLRGKHEGHTKFFTKNCGRLEFGVAHHSKEVVYDAKELFQSNNDSIADDVIRMFSKQCNFGFVTHLFGSDLKSTVTSELVHGEDFLHQASQRCHVAESGPSFVSSSTIQTFSQDFQARLDGLLKTLVHAQPWFILCIKPFNIGGLNTWPGSDTGLTSQLLSYPSGDTCVFDHEVVSRQIKSLQIFETVYLMRSGYTHRMRILPFAQRYFASQDDELTQEEAVDIITSYQRMMVNDDRTNPSKTLFLGKKHVFFSELLWQDLERDREEKEMAYELLRKKKFADGLLLKERRLGNETITSPEKRPETPCVLADLDVSTPPPIPKRRGYTVIDNKKIAFPQIRIMKEDYVDVNNGQQVVFHYGETLKVTGASPKAGFLSVESKDKSGWVPYKLTKLLNDTA